MTRTARPRGRAKVPSHPLMRICAVHKNNDDPKCKVCVIARQWQREHAAK